MDLAGAGACLLTEPQRRALAVSLRHIETELTWIEALMASDGAGILVSFANDLGEARRSSLHDRIHAARTLIRELRDALALLSETIPKSRWIAGHAIQLWVVTEESLSGRLRGYGAVVPELSHILDPRLRALGDLLLAMP